MGLFSEFIIDFLGVPPYNKKGCSLHMVALFVVRLSGYSRYFGSCLLTRLTQNFFLNHNYFTPNKFIFYQKHIDHQ
jgi:hypothetical protein